MKKVLLMAGALIFSVSLFAGPGPGNRVQNSSSPKPAVSQPSSTPTDNGQDKDKGKHKGEGHAKGHHKGHHKAPKK